MHNQWLALASHSSFNPIGFCEEQNPIPNSIRDYYYHLIILDHIPSKERYLSERTGLYLQ
jgi:hypothetical protein